MSKQVSLDDCLDYVIDNRGVTPHKRNTEWADVGIPVLSANNVKTSGLQKMDEIRYIPDDIYSSWMKKPLEKGDILLTSEAPAGEVMYWDSDKKIIVGQRLYGLKVKKEINSKYLKFYLESQTGQNEIKKHESGSTVFGISAKTFSAIKISLPSRDIQDKIGELLYSIECQIKRNNEMVQKLQVLSQAIFNSYFSDETEMVSLIDFPFAKILKPGITKFEGQKHYIATAEVEGDKVNYDAPLIDYETRENRANMQPVKNSVWFAKMKNSVKHLYISKEDSLLLSSYILSTGFCGLECDDIAFEYMINYINLPYFENKKNILSHGATMEGVNNDDLKSMHIHLPSNEKLIAFHSKTKNIHCQISIINQKTFELTKLKEKLLPLLINGQLR